MQGTTKEMEENDEEDLNGRYLTFQIGAETYETKYMIEIVGLQPVTVMPKMPIKGIVGLFPVMDIRRPMNMPPRVYNDRTCIIVTGLSGLLTGLIIDSVSEVLSIGTEDIIPKPRMGMGSEHGTIKNLGEQKAAHFVY